MTNGKHAVQEIAQSSAERSFAALGLRVDKRLSTPAYQQIVEGVQSALKNGGLAPGDSLPAMRTAAADLGVNQMTVSKAYKSLAAMGVVQGNSGGGTKVTDVKPLPLIAKSDSQPSASSIRQIVRMAELACAPGVIALTDAYPHFSASKLESFRMCLNEVMSSGAESIFRYAAPAGIPELRKALKNLLGRGGLNIEADDIIVTSGAQQALDMAARLILSPGDTIIVEGPCYFGALDSLRSLGASIVALQMQPGGVAADAFREACAAHSPKAFYTIPTVHNPTGFTTSLARRREILDIAKDYGCTIIEDDYCPELHFGNEKMPSYKELGAGEVDVYYVRSLGKIYLPGTRLGLLIPPAGAMTSALRLKQVTDMHGPLLLQAAAAIYLERYHDSDELAAELALIEDKALSLFNELERRLPETFSVKWITGGLSFWIEFPQALDDEAIYFSAIRNSVAFALGSAFEVASDAVSHGVRVSFGGLDHEQIIEGAARLGSAMDGLLKDSKRSLNIMV
ncbi:transcriptional regulator, GntR family with aminotransferase domain-containing protein [Pseudomonas syringae pv. theae ICMP 3923]|uniref:Transcriptional regulator, GntR family with aminotransferase domain-containing protein n=1 Tax=Pseudomonas syringae pv. theae TaxID=103985 RepID=A0A0Q0DX90_PSESX|nr:PLP-dependent aminotransferase family protein [Pseudomonas syringae]EPM65521.1 transcriptional regulator, GntR family with aminotransferase domain-containing protein [Pseudomonas syringae pv. theae ICMP 3923]KPZ35040.1 hypothetical protein AN901_201381 [Pseudomonas syringae pv. theae]MBL3873044.1 PLP-dependent aminotransferase family protein [Pseudomonas syringae pv. theae]RMT63255.1 Transcriptional regulator, GntR family with aminotransferase domain-containing protein [Pseudomonas syringae 